MMTSTLCTCTWLLLPCCVLVTLSTGELDFYQDELPKSLDRVSLRQLIKYLEDQKTILSSLLANKARKKNLFEALANKESIAEFLRKENYPDRWNHRRMRYNEPINEIPEQRGRYFPFYKFNSFESPLEEYPDFELPYFPREAADEDTTYERHPFAVKPNDPRYYQDGPFFFDDDNDDDDDDDEDEKSDFEEPTKNETEWQHKDTEMEEVHDVREERPRNIESKFKDTSVVVVPDLERRTEYNPLFVPVNQDFDSDIYFIAVVAGCSAAAIFALVIIALTWCRLKRSAKAAADIEYPAYGVTGPNKEISPSGDQRLAQSAQMYHFQHQKQQIIAMENRISATRDPGSVSEAESDEENEEGDYTVYECPGLASTGEMEVKNPLFHDDPTPATPAQTNKKEDHI